MSRRPRPHPFVRALQKRLPDATITVSRQTNWFSMTFAGERLEMFVSLSGIDARQRLDQFADTLPDAEFALPDKLVADIAIIRLATDSNSAILSIEALVLDA